MNDQQLEKASRKLCELRGIDPDAQVSHAADPSPSGWVPGVSMSSPAWMRVSREIVSHLQCDEAIASAGHDENAGEDKALVDAKLRAMRLEGFKWRGRPYDKPGAGKGEKE